MTPIFKRQQTEPHVSNIPADPIDLSQIIGIILVGLVAVILLLYTLIVRCRYLRRRTCSTCGSVVPVTGRERVEGFWQRVWHEGCWRDSHGVTSAVEKGKGRARGERKEGMAMIPPARVVGQSRHSPASSLDHLDWTITTPATSMPSSPLAAPGNSTVAARLSGLSVEMANIKQQPLYDPYAPHSRRTSPITQPCSSTIQPPLRTTSRQVESRSHLSGQVHERKTSTVKFGNAPSALGVQVEAESEELLMTHSKDVPTRNSSLQDVGKLPGLAL